MAVSVTCPGCRTSYPVTEDLLGKTIRCKKCQETFTARAAKASVVAGRAADERIQKGSPRAEHLDDDEVDDLAPRNGKAGAMKRRPEPAGGNKTGLIVGGSIGGITILGLVGALIWSLNREPEKTPEPAKPVSFASGNNNGGSPAVTPPATDNKNLADVKPTENKPETKPAEVKAADAKPGDMKPTVAQMTTATQLLGGVRMVRPADFKTEVVERAKKSACIIYCVFQQGGAFGSGWVAEANGNERYIITNSHVVGMKEREKPAPDKIQVTFESGTPQARTFEGKLLALDREEDLAVIRVKGPDLPPPLKIAPSFDLQDTQKLLILGFPFGGNLAQMMGGGVTVSLKARQTTVAGRMYNKDSSVKYIQVEGGADPGNSGGAVVDTNGNVSAILVAGIPGTNLRFVIPSEYAMHLLAGRMLRVRPAQAILSGSQVRQPIEADIADPLRRIRSVSIDVWVGKPPPATGLKIRSASEKSPSPLEGDGPRSTTNLDFNPEQQVKIGEAHAAKGELTLPALSEGQVYWFQPHYIARDNKERWGEAIVLEMGRHPVEAKPAMLAIQHKMDKPQDVRNVLISSREVIGLEVEGLGNRGSDLSLKALLTEKTRLVEPNGDAKIRIQYTGDLQFGEKDQDTAFRSQLRGVLESVKNLGAEVTINKEGVFRSSKPDFALVPQRARPILGVFNSQIIESLEALTITLPNKDVQPGDTWGFEIAHTIPYLPGRTENSLFKFTAKYIGSRLRNGRQEAVIELNGSVVKDQNAGGRSGDSSPPGRPGAVGGGDTPGSGNDPGSADEEGGRRRGVFGRLHGAAVVDIATGHVLIARSESDTVIGTKASFPTRDGGTLQVDVFIGHHLDTMLQRGLTKDPLKPIENPAVLLPNMEQVYNPLVGVGEPLVADAPPPSAVVVPERATNMRPEVMKKVQKAAVMIDVEEQGGGGGSGSGWFAEPGIVVTNCHVVGMENKSARKPAKITVILDSGLPTERKLSGKLLAINREDDLSVIKVEGDNLPEPMRIVSSGSLVESNKLTILGFPNGAGLAKMLGQGLNVRDLKTSLKTRTTTVAGRVHQLDETVKHITYEGGGDPGNSGSAVVDVEGNVRCVHVAGVIDPRNGMRSTLKLGIPAEYALRTLQGYPMEFETPYAYLDGSSARQPIRILFADPLRRLSRSAIDVWVGSSGKPRKPSETLPKVETGDSVRQTFELKIEPDASGLFMAAVGEFPLPNRTPGQVYWLQPRFVNGTGKEQWGRAQQFAPDGPPLERREIAVKHKLPKVGTERTLELKSDTIFHWAIMDDQTQEGYPLKATVIEKIGQPVKQQAMAQLTYKDIEFTILPISTGNPIIDTELRRLFKAVLDVIKGTITLVRITPEGLMKNPQTSFARVPPAGWLLAKQFNDQLMQSLMAMTIPIPDRKLKYNDPSGTWKHPTNLFIETKNRFEAALFNMEFKYFGARTRGGRLEAVIEITGSLAGDKSKSIDVKDLKGEKPAGGANPSPVDPSNPTPPTGPGPPEKQPSPPGAKSAKALYGVAKGYAYIDVEGGYVAEVHLFVDVDVEMMVTDPDSKDKIPVPAGGTMDILFKRLTNAGSR